MKNVKLNYLFLIFAAALVFTACKNGNEKKEADNTGQEAEEATGISKLEISENNRFFQTENGEPFFWLGDTGWLLFRRLDRKEAVKYLEDRKEKGYNVIQAMVLHSLDVENAYGDKALKEENVAQPVITEGSDFENEEAYDYWDHVDYIVKKAEEMGLYMALVPVWGSNIEKVSEEQVIQYGDFLTERYKDSDHIIWFNGGDTFGNEYTEVWNALGKTLKENNPDKLVTFHPRGRTQSSDWFHNEDWLDFNSFQSGHRRYDQDDTEKNYGEDNWRYVKVDYNMKPIKPTVDTEPSYEGIPEGLHDPEEGFWDDDAVRRYGYWSVFAGAAGYTYGHSAIMQMHKEEGEVGAYGNEKLWTEALDDPGATQMKYLKQLMLDFPYFERVPDQSLVLNSGERYDYIVATRGEDYALIYTYTGREIEVDFSKIGDTVEAFWFNPRNGEKETIDTVEGAPYTFNPPGDEEEGNDWVLILEAK